MNIIRLISVMLEISESLFKKLNIALTALDIAKYADDDIIRKTVMDALAKIDEIK